VSPNSANECNLVNKIKLIETPENNIFVPIISEHLNKYIRIIWGFGNVAEYKINMPNINSVFVSIFIMSTWKLLRTKMRDNINVIKLTANKKPNPCSAPVAHVCNPSGGRDQKY
jgi:hypothetical protein